MKQKLFNLFVCIVFFNSLAFGQEKNVTGRVTSSKDENLPDVTVAVSGTSRGTRTNGNGIYSIQVSPGETLIFKYIGFSDKKIVVGSSDIYNVTLVSSESVLDEVLVVGYGSGRSRSSVVGSYVQVTTNDIKGKPSANALETLQGKVPGLQVFTSSGEPSVTQSVRLQGVGSLGASSTPLYVLDGTPINTGSIVSMNPEDFESITVLKDASATSIYGSRAANGVIYFTSKKGKASDRATVTARAQYGWTDLASRKIQNTLMTSSELQDFWLETKFKTQKEIDEIRKNWPNDFKWDTYYFQKNVPLKQMDLNISGGSARTQYYISAGYMDAKGVMYRSGFDRVTLRSNITSHINDWIQLGVNLAGGYDRRETNGWTSNNTNGGLALLVLPWYTPYDKNGKEYYEEQIPGWGRYSPKYLADKNPNRGRNQQFNPNVFVQAIPVKNLILRSQAGIDYFNYRGSSRRMPSYAASPRQGTGNESWTQGVARTLTNTIEYKLVLKDKHKLGILGGHEFSDYDEQNFSASVEGLTDDALILLSAGSKNKNVGQTKTQYAYNSYFGRLSYGYNDTYYIDGTLRQDESSRFGRENRKATFWSVGGMWNMKKEKFLSDVDWINTLQIRASTGTSGNSAIGNYNSLNTVSANIYDGQTSWGIVQPGNPNLAWEEQIKTNVGFGVRLFDRLNLDIEFFNRVTKNMLVDVPYPYTSGFSAITENVGSLRNRGMDISFSVDIVRSSDYYFSPYVNLGVVQQKVTELFQGKNYWIIPNTGVSWVVGKPIEFFYPIQSGVNPETGLMEWFMPGDDISQTTKDPGRVTSVFSSSALQQSTGIKRYPPFNGGFGFQSGYKGIYVNADFIFSSGKYLINNDRYFFENSSNFAGFNQSRNVRDYWKAPGDQTRFPKYGQVNQFDSGLIENASFIRLKGLTIGYNLPKSLFQNMKFFKGTSVYYTGRNLLLFTKYQGPDPEIDTNVTTGANPNTKQSVLGIELQF